MTLSVALHRPVAATAFEFQDDCSKRMFASLTITSDDGSQVKVFAEPHICRAMADAFSDANAQKREASRHAAWEARCEANPAFTRAVND